MLIVEWKKYEWPAGYNCKNWHYQPLKTFQTIQEIKDWWKEDLYNIKITRVFVGGPDIMVTNELSDFVRENNPLVTK